MFLRLNAFCDDRKPETAAQCNDHFGNRDIIGIIDGIVDDRGLSHEEIAAAVMSSAFDAFDTLGQLDDATLTNLRYEKYRAIGQYRTM